MFALFQKNLCLWGFGKAIALFAGCLIFSISGRVNHELSYEQHILSAVSDHYYLTYFMLPMVLLTCFSFLEDDEMPVILRFQSYHGYFLRKWFGAGIIALLLAIIQTAAILLSGIGLSLGNQWGLTVGATEAELFLMLQQFFSTPVQAFIIFTFYQFIGSWLISGICLWIGHFAGRKWSVRMIVVLYIISAVWIKVPAIQSLPLTSFNHLLVLHHNLGIPYRFEVTGVTLLLLALIIIVSIQFLWRGLPHLHLQGRGIATYYFHELMTRRSLLPLCGVVLGFTLYKGLGYSMGSSTEWIYTLFSGHGTGYFQVLPFLELLITGGTPLYLLAAFVEHRVSGQSIFISVRAKNRKNLMTGILSVSAKFVGVYVLFWLAGGLLGTFFVGDGIEKSVFNVLLYAVLMKYFDVFFQFLVMLCVYLFTKKVSIGFLVVLAGNMLCVLPGHGMAWFPFGLSSLMRISFTDSGIGISAAAALCIEISLVILLMVWMFAFGYKKILD